MRTYEMTIASGTWDITDIPVPQEAFMTRRRIANRSRDPFWKRVGLAPLDDEHVTNGLMTYTDPAPKPKLKIQDQPFGGLLSIYAQFDVADSVASYTVELVPVRPDGQHGTKSPITDPLVNSFWDNTGPKPGWIHVNLCPPAGGRYTNIDNDARTWLYPADRKVTWDSRRLADGLYRIIITPYDSQGIEISRPYYQTPILRISNKLPYLTLETIQEVGVCGAATVDANRIIQFKATFTHNEGDVRSPRFWATRGPAAEAAGDLTTPVKLPPPQSDWPPYTVTLDFRVKPTACPAMAYSFSLFVYGAATNCFSQYMYWTQKTMNLIVATPQTPRGN